MAVDCKCFGSKVDVKDMEAFIGMLDDVGVNLGMLFTTVGFTPGAERRGAQVLREVVPLVNIAVFDQVSSWWLMRAGQHGHYAGDYVDHEPYGKFWWRASFITGEPPNRRKTFCGPLAPADGTWRMDRACSLLCLHVIASVGRPTPNRSTISPTRSGRDCGRSGLPSEHGPGR